MSERDPSRYATTDGKAPHPEFSGYESPAPQPVGANGQHKAYWVLSERERAKGFVRPVRRSYVHTVCGGQTTMASAIAETYAREPKFYGATFCVNCGKHLPLSEFVWLDRDGRTTSEVVGS